MNYFLASIIVIETIALIASGFYLLKFSKIIFKVEDELEASLDILDERYKSISKVLEIPIFYDSPEIRKVVDDIRTCKESILRVANSVAKIEEEEINER